MKNEPATSLEKESDDYLIELMGLKGDFPAEALAAYGIIYNRYWARMLKIAMGVNRNKYRPNWAEEAQDLVADTFRNIYEKAGSFKKGRLKKEKNIRYQILSWMTTVMKNCFYDLYLDEVTKENIKVAKKQDNPETVLDELYLPKVSLMNHFVDAQNDFLNALEESEIQNIDDPVQIEHPKQKSDNFQMIESYLETLSDRDAHIIRTHYNFHVEGKNTPTEILDILEKECNTTRVNIRRIVSNFNKNIYEALQPKIKLRS